MNTLILEHKLLEQQCIKALDGHLLTDYEQIGLPQIYDIFCRQLGPWKDPTCTCYLDVNTTLKERG